MLGKTEEEKLHANMVVEVFRMDIAPLLRNIFLAKEEEKESLKKEVQEKVNVLLKALDTHYVGGTETFLGKSNWVNGTFRYLFETILKQTKIRLTAKLFLLKLMKLQNSVNLEKYSANITLHTFIIGYIFRK